MTDDRGQHDLKAETLASAKMSALVLTLDDPTKLVQSYGKYPHKVC